MTDRDDAIEMGGMMHGMARVEIVRDGLVYAAPIPKAACGGCAAAKGCGVSALSGYFGNRSRQLVLPDDFGAQVGETIEIGLPQSTLNKAAMVSYAPPVLGLLVAAGLAGSMGAGDGLSALAAGVGLVGGFALSRFVSKRLTDLSPVFLKKTSIPDGACHEG